MLWSLIKILAFVVLIAALAWGASWLLEAEGGVTIQFLGEELPLTPIKAVIAVLLFALALWVLFKVVGFLIAFLKFINGDNTAISRYFARNRQNKGMAAVTEAMLAMASGEGKAALIQAKRADKLLDQPALTKLLTAQAATEAGETKIAEEAYKSLLDDNKTRFVGVQGLLGQKLAAGDTEVAGKLAQKAFSLNPKHEPTQNMLLKLQSTNEDWSGARKTIGAKLKHGQIPRDLHKRRDAVLSLAQSRALRLEGKVDEAQAIAIEANRLSPTLVPAAVAAAKAYHEQEKPRYATKVLKAAWEENPHPSIAAAFAALGPDETPQARLKRFGALFKSNPQHAETVRTKAELALTAGDTALARTTLTSLVETDPTVRSVTLMAAIEKVEGASEDVVRSRITQAISAQRDAQWICSNCGEFHDDWEPVCDSCGGMDTLSWTRPPMGDVSNVQTLPLVAAPFPADSAAEAVTVSEDVVLIEDKES